MEKQLEIPFKPKLISFDEAMEVILQEMDRWESDTLVVNVESLGHQRFDDAPYKSVVISRDVDHTVETSAKELTKRVENSDWYTEDDD